MNLCNETKVTRLEDPHNILMIPLILVLISGLNPVPIYI